MDSIRPGALIFVKGTDFLAHEIEKITNSSYSHVAMYIGDGKLIEAQGFERISYVSLSKYIDEYDVFDTKLNKNDFDIGYFWLKKQLGKKYDYWDIVVLFFKLVFKLHLPWKERNRFICSRLARDFLFRCGLQIPDDNMTPEDLYEWCKANIK